MTICLALLCENGGQLVAVADRMLSVDFLELEYEQRIRKIDVLSPYAVALTAGDALAHTILLRRAGEELQRLKQPTVHEVAEQIETSFIRERHELAEKTVLRRAGLDHPTFLESMTKLPEDVAFGLLTQFQEVQLGLELLVGGIDSTGAHIYLVNDPGVSSCFDGNGYVAIGSGLPHAESFLSEADYSPNIPVRRAMWLAYVAKRRSERAPGVGKATDMLVIDDKKGVRFVDGRVLAVLEAAYNEYVESLAKASSKAEASLTDLNLSFEDEGGRRARRKEKQTPS